MSVIGQIAKNTVSGWIAVATRAVVGILLVPFLLRHLGQEGYGLIGLFGTTIGMASVVDLGLRSALGRELAEQVVRRDHHAFAELLSTSLVLYLGIAGAIALTLWIAAPWLVAVFKVSAPFQPTAVSMLRVYGAGSLILAFITPVFTAALSSHHRFDLVNLVGTCGALLSGLTLFLVIPAVDHPLYGWVATMLFYQFVFVAVYFMLFRRVCPEYLLRARFLNAARLRPLFQLGGYMYALQLTQMLASRADPLIISYFFGPAGVALYQPGSKLSELVGPIVRTLADQIYPLTTRQHVDHQQEKMQRILVQGTKYTLLLGSLFSAGMLIFAMPFCRLWLGDEMPEEYRIVAYVMMGWAVYDLLTHAAGTQWPVLLGMKRLRFLLWTQLPSAVLNLIISIYIVGFTPLGIPGVMVATVFITLLRRPVLAWYTAKACGLPPGIYFRQGYLRPLGCFAITALTACLVRLFLSLDTFVLLGIAACTVGAAWMLSCWFVGFERRERSAIVAAVSQQTRRVRRR